jgi:hypothetical protein
MDDKAEELLDNGQYDSFKECEERIRQIRLTGQSVAIEGAQDFLSRALVLAPPDEDNRDEEQFGLNETLLIIRNYLRMIKQLNEDLR